MHRQIAGRASESYRGEQPEPLSSGLAWLRPTETKVQTGANSNDSVVLPTQGDRKISAAGGAMMKGTSVCCIQLPDRLLKFLL